MRVDGGFTTKDHQANLCDSCRWFVRIKGAKESEEDRKCSRFKKPPFQVVIQCGSYDEDKAEVYAYEEQAYILMTLKDGRKKFMTSMEARKIQMQMDEEES